MVELDPTVALGERPSEAGHRSPRAGGDGSQWRVMRHSSPSYLADEEPRQQSQWTLVSRRRETLNNLENRTLVIWGVPHDVPAYGVLRQTLNRINEGVSSCKWRGVGYDRHVALIFTNSLAKDARKKEVRQRADAMGWRAVEGRRWATRNQQRLGRSPSPESPLSPWHAMDVDEDCYTPPTSPDSPVSEPGERFVSSPNFFGRLEISPSPSLSDPPSPPPLPPPFPPPLSNRGAGRSKAVRISRHLKDFMLSMMSLNVQKGIKSKITELEEYGIKYWIDVMAIQEAGSNLKLSKAEARGYKQFTHPQGDVCFYVARYLVPYVVQLPPSHGGQLWIKITAGNGHKPLFLCSVHMPQECSTVQERTVAWEALQLDAAAYAEAGEVAILGDLNARAGDPKNAEEKRLLGEFGEPGDRTQNGKLKVSLLKGGLTSLIGQRQPPRCSLRGTGFWYTRYDQVHDVKHALDDVLVSRSLLHAAPRLWVDYTDLGSDHSALRVKVRCPRKVSRPKKGKYKKTVFRLEKMIAKSSRECDLEAAEGARESYQKCIEEEFKDFDAEALAEQNLESEDRECGCSGENQCVCGVVAEFIKRTEAALEKSVGTKVICRGFSRKWYDLEAHELVKKRRKTRGVQKI